MPVAEFKAWNAYMQSLTIQPPTSDDVITNKIDKFMSRYK